jgi:hypothetical protein
MDFNGERRHARRKLGWVSDDLAGRGSLRGPHTSVHVDEAVADCVQTTGHHTGGDAFDDRLVDVVRLTKQSPCDAEHGSEPRGTKPRCASEAIASAKLKMD